MSSSAANSVFNITELLEMILLELPPQHLLVVGRVNRKWREVITSVAKFRTLLHYKPILDNTRKTMLHPCPPRVFSPLRLELNDGEDWYYTCATLTPFQYEAICDLGPGCWQNAYVTQPPIHELKIPYLRYIDYCCGDGPFYPMNPSCLTAYVPTGLTWGDIQKALLQKRQHLDGLTCTRRPPPAYWRWLLSRRISDANLALLFILFLLMLLPPKTKLDGLLMIIWTFGMRFVVTSPRPGYASSLGELFVSSCWESDAPILEVVSART